MTCEHARSAGAEPGPHAAEVQAHLDDCLPCHINLHALAFGIAVLKRTELPPNPDLVNRILSRLEPASSPRPDTVTAPV